MPARTKKFRKKQDLLLAITLIGATFPIVGFFLGLAQRQQLLQELQSRTKPLFF